MRTIPELLAENAAKWSERAALVETRCGRDVSVSFQTLHADVERMATHLLANGIRAGDAVLIFVPISVQLYVVLLAVFRIGAVAVFVDPSSGLRRVNACCERVPIKAVVARRPWLWLRFLLRGRPLGIVSRTINGGRIISAPTFPQANDAALVTFTSGSTGAPKAIVRTHRFLLAQHEALARAIGHEEGEVALTTLPIFVLANLASGITTILPDAKISHPGTVNPTPLARQIARLKPTRTEGSPAFYERLLREPATLAQFKKIYLGGAPLFPSLMRELRRNTTAKIVMVYGSSEAEPIAECALDEIEAGNGLLAGRVVPEIELRIVDDEIIVTGEHVLKGYLGGVGDAETKIFIDGKIWHRTGDAGYLDEQGRLWLLGRCSAKAVLEDGRAIYPFQMECAAMNLPFVKRAAMLFTDGKLNCFVETALPLSSAQHAELQAALALFPPHAPVRLKRIPVDARHNAKIDYGALRKKFPA